MYNQMSYLALLHMHTLGQTRQAQETHSLPTPCKGTTCAIHMCAIPLWGPKGTPLLIPAIGRDSQFMTCNRGSIPSLIYLQLDGITDTQRGCIFWRLLHFLRLLHSLHSAWHYRNAHQGEFRARTQLHGNRETLTLWPQWFGT